VRECGPDVGERRALLRQKRPHRSCNGRPDSGGPVRSEGAGQREYGAHDADHGGFGYARAEPHHLGLLMEHAFAFATPAARR
jgi:hypothetical protein